MGQCQYGTESGLLLHDAGGVEFHQSEYFVPSSAVPVELE
jgi:hypothetical protein